MVSVVLGTKVKEFSFNISDVDLETLKGKDPDYTISKNGDIVVSDSKSEYVVLSGTFNWTRILNGDYEGGIKELDAITVVENGQVTYKASGLGMTGVEVESGAVFKDFLADKAYGIRGNAFSNEITSADKNDVLHGMSGNDTIYAEAGIDRLFGDDGADRLVGCEGNDFLTGGLGADIFEFEAGDGRDVILDFHASGKGQDHIDLSVHVDVSSFADLEISRSGKSVLIEFGDDSILLKDVSAKDIGAADFSF